MSRSRVLWIILLLVLAGVIGLYAQSYYLPQEHQQATVAIEQMGGTVTVKRRFILGLPVSRFTVANLSDSRVTDPDLARLKALVNLSALLLDGTSVTDAGLAHLKEMPLLETLSLRRTRVSEAGVKDLRNALPQAKLTSSYLSFPAAARRGRVDWKTGCWHGLRSRDPHTAEYSDSYRTVQPCRPSWPPHLHRGHCRDRSGLGRTGGA